MYQYLDTTTGDAEFLVRANSLGGLLEESGRALVGLMYDRKMLNQEKEIEIEVDGGNPEELLYNWLTEILFTQDVENVFFKDFNVEISEKDKKIIAKAKCVVQHGDPKLVEAHVKAVTYHNFYVKQADGRWEARVVVDM